MSDNPIFAIAERAARLRADGVDVVTLAAGEPQAATTRLVIDAAVAAAQDPDAHHYGPAQGEPALRVAIAEHLSAETAARWREDQIQVTLGAKHALHLAVQAVGRPRDEVLVARPGWPGHCAAVEAAGMVPVPVPTDSGFRFAVAGLDAARTSRTRALIISSPGNPAGAVHDQALLQSIAEWAAFHDIWVISDDIYAAFDYTGRHRSILAVAPEHRERVVVVGSVSKEHAMTGWRIGWLAAPEPVISAARRHVAQTITHVPTVPQRAAIAALGDSGTPRRAAVAYRARRDRLAAALNTVDGIDAPAPDGGMFVFVDARDYMATHGFATSAELANRLLEIAHVAVVPGEAFDAPGHLRLCFAVDDDTLDTAITRLMTALSSAARARIEGPTL